MRRAFVTGGAGFVGHHLVKALIDKGWAVTVYDNLSYGRLEFLKPFQGEKGFQFVRGDLLNTSRLRQSLTSRYDTVFHLAANSDIPKGIRDPRWDFEQGTSATFNVLETMRRRGVTRLVFASSSAVYGEHGTRALREEDGPLSPISQYGASKLACEGLISAYVHNYGFQGWIYRFANVIGEGATHGAMYDFIARLKNNPRELRVLGNGRQAKPYLYVGDCVEGMWHGFRRARQPCNVLNLTTAGATSVKTIAVSVIQAMGLKGARIRYTGGERGWRGDVPQVRLNGSRMKGLGWTPRFTSDQAVRVGIRRQLDQS